MIFYCFRNKKDLKNYLRVWLDVDDILIDWAKTCQLCRKEEFKETILNIHLYFPLHSLLMAMSVFSLHYNCRGRHFKKITSHHITSNPITTQPYHHLIDLHILKELKEYMIFYHLSVQF